jgi:putative membrane protein
MKRNAQMFAGLMVVGIVGAVSVAIAQESATRMTADHNFAAKAAQGGMAEVKLGELAKEHGESPDVKAFGARMVKDHTMANDELKAIAARKGITLPADMDAKDQARYDRLSKMNGAEFDKSYMRDMVSDHKTDIAEFRRESERGTDADIKAFAAKTLPTLEEHLKMAESAEAKVKGEK